MIISSGYQETIKINGRTVNLTVYEPDHMHWEVVSARYQDTGARIDPAWYGVIGHYFNQGLKEIGGLHFSADDDHYGWEDMG
jgi:hypothetical protein